MASFRLTRALSAKASAVDQDHGRYRLTFFLGSRRLRLIVDEATFAAACKFSFVHEALNLERLKGRTNHPTVGYRSRSRSLMILIGYLRKSAVSGGRRHAKNANAVFASSET
jgi:Family of unknown function (DUF6522)